MASVNSWFLLPKILFFFIVIESVRYCTKMSTKNAKHQKLLNLLCIVYIIQELRQLNLTLSHNNYNLTLLLSFCQIIELPGNCCQKYHMFDTSFHTHDTSPHLLKMSIKRCCYKQHLFIDLFTFLANVAKCHACENS